jgi:membrane protein YqaA with SNARE-associated domain
VRIVSRMYDRVITWSRHRHAERYLALLSFAESSFFLVPPDVMLAPMTLAQPERGWRFAFVTTISSVIGGLAGYAIGWFALDLIKPILEFGGHLETYEIAAEWFARWGFWAILVAGFTPIPYKIFTIAGGAMHMLLPGFILASFLGRGARFFLVAGLIVAGGERMEKGIRRNIDMLGWLMVAAIIVVVLYLSLR